MDSMKERAEEIAKLAGIELSFGAMRNPPSLHHFGFPLCYCVYPRAVDRLDDSPPLGREWRRHPIR